MAGVAKVRPATTPAATASKRLALRTGYLGGKALRYRFLAALQVFSLGISTAYVSASPVSVRYEEGVTRAFLVISTLDGNVIAEGELNQVVRGGHVRMQTVFHFKDGSWQEETTVYSQRGAFRLISYHQLQKGPAFKHASEISVTTATGQVTVHYTDDDGKEKGADEHMALPPDLANGMVPTLLKNLPKGTSQLEVPMVVAAPKPRLVKLAISAQGTDRFSAGGSERDAVHYVVKIVIGGVAGAVAPLLGKEPPDSHIWILGGEAPTFVKSESLSYMGGPLWRMELTSPVWPQAPAESKSGAAEKR